MAMGEIVRIAILAKAPIPGYSKTRLIPALGARGAADLQAAFIRDTVETALAAATGPVSLWCAPDTAHPLFVELAASQPVDLQAQPEADLGERMLTAVQGARGPVLVIGTDCPAFTPQHLREAASALVDGADVVLTPVDDGGYVLIGMREERPDLFRNIVWSTPSVADDTVRVARGQGLSVVMMPTLWDVDEPADLDRLRELSRPIP